MIIALHKMDFPTPKGIIGFAMSPLWGWDGYLHNSIIVSSLRDWVLRNHEEIVSLAEWCFVRAIPGRRKN
jgi:hypothetical protein